MSERMEMLVNTCTDLLLGDVEGSSKRSVSKYLYRSLVG